MLEEEKHPEIKDESSVKTMIPTVGCVVEASAPYLVISGVVNDTENVIKTVCVTAITHGTLDMPGTTRSVMAEN